MDSAKAKSFFSNNVKCESPTGLVAVQRDITSGYTDDGWRLVTGQGDYTDIGLVPSISTTLQVVCSDVHDRDGDRTEQQRSDNLSQLVDFG